METDAVIARVFKALCDENRIAIIKMLCSGEKCACEIYDALVVTKPTITHHMKILIDSNIILARKAGKWTYYSLNSDGMVFAKTMLEDLFFSVECHKTLHQGHAHSCD